MNNQKGIYIFKNYIFDHIVHKNFFHYTVLTCKSLVAIEVKTEGENKCMHYRGTLQSVNNFVGKELGFRVSKSKSDGMNLKIQLPFLVNHRRPI